MNSEGSDTKGNPAAELLSKQGPEAYFGPNNCPPERATEAYLAKKASDKELVVHLVDSLEKARSEEVLKFCVSELTSGTTYNDLRLKLGLQPRNRFWQEIRLILAEMIMPADEEEALMASHSLSGYMIKKIEQFQERVSSRAEDLRGDKNEHFFMKMELESMKLITEKLDKRIEHYLKMKELQKAERKTQGQTVVFNNKFYIPRPGEVLKDATPLEDAARLLNGVLSDEP